ncbi:hypothetical protein Cch01nite_12150 [Cellulomonas chitinilytica]|uniref:DUF4180 domain-containing protein n=1 Tax=Cellulomonas chitinilytica TaxID=398759 RepID=A0A919P2J5_9CELL|nr:DUF4180 domain-containing protein [Cellulomonas chitinilytica]GIG20491.1 hypothetical protein Cch01nite_12150 [Cellulomonas chitinilytica]
MRIEEHGDVRVQYLDHDGPVISSSADASDLIGNAWAQDAGVVAVPVGRLDPEFFRLSSLVAGEFLQKAVNYHVQIAVIGDITEYVERSDALRDFVYESNRGDHAWFLPDEAALAARLAASPRR